MKPEQIANIVAQIGENFRTFGGDRSSGDNPIAHAMKGKPLAFAAMVSVEDVECMAIKTMNCPLRSG